MHWSFPRLPYCLFLKQLLKPVLFNTTFLGYPWIYWITLGYPWNKIRVALKMKMKMDTMKLLKMYNNQIKYLNTSHADQCTYCARYSSCKIECKCLTHCIKITDYQNCIGWFQRNIIDITDINHNAGKAKCLWQKCFKQVVDCFYDKSWPNKHHLFTKWEKTCVYTNSYRIRGLRVLLNEVLIKKKSR